MRRRRSPEIIVGRVSAAGTPIVGGEYTVEKLGVGQYRVRITAKNFRIGAILVTSGADGQIMHANLESTSSFLTTNRITNTHATSDSAFNFIVVGV